MIGKVWTNSEKWDKDLMFTSDDGKEEGPVFGCPHYTAKCDVTAEEINVTKSEDGYYYYEGDESCNPSENQKLKEPILVWHYEDAPEELRNLTNPCDKDWIALVPPGYPSWISWAEDGTAFGVCSVDEFDHPTKKGYKVRIGCHS